MVNRFNRAAALIMAGVCLLLLTSCQGQLPGGPQGPASGLTLDAVGGFGGYARPNDWTPITVTAENTGPDISGELRLEINPLTGGRIIYTRQIDLPSTSRKVVTLYVNNYGNLSSVRPLSVSLVDGGRVLATVQPQMQTIAPQTLLVALWSDTPQALNETLGDLLPPTEIRVTNIDEEDIPDMGRGLDGLDVLVVSDADTGLLTAAQRTALSQWVAGGGRLVIVGGLTFQRTLSGLEELSPMAATDTQNIRYESLAEQLRTPFPQAAPEQGPLAIGLLQANATTVISVDNETFVASRRLGSGQVDFFAADPNLEPLRTWEGSTVLWTTVLTNRAERPGWAYGFNSNDWESARQAAAIIPGVSLPSVLQLCAFLGLYVVLVGPVNYLVLARLKRRELAWVTVPVLVIIFAALAYVTGFQVRGSRPILNRLAVIQSWSGSDVSEVNMVMGVWSPRRARYEINLPENFLGTPLPRTFSSGLAAPSSVSLETSNPAAIEDVRVDVGAVEPFTISGFADDINQIQGQASVYADEQELRIEGEIINASSDDLTNVRLLFAGTSTTLPNLPAGEVLEIDEVLTGTRAVPAGGNGLDPLPSSSDPYGYGYYGSPLVTDLTNNQDCYYAEEARRRCNLITSMINGDSRGEGVYLIAWGTQLPIEMQIADGDFDSVDTVVHIVELETTFENLASDDITLPAALTQWRVTAVEPTGYSYIRTPYDLYLSPNQLIAYRFEPIITLEDYDFSTVTLNMEQGYNYSDQLPLVDLYDFDSSAWERIQADWGSTTLENAERFVDTSGAVEVRITAAPGDYYEAYLSRLDIALAR